MWEMKVVVLSTGHLREETMVALVNSRPDSDFVYTVPMPDGGVMVFTDSVGEDEPEELLAAVEWAEGRGYDWVRFDRDGDTVESLELFEWKEE